MVSLAMPYSDSKHHVCETPPTSFTSWVGREIVCHEDCSCVARYEYSYIIPGTALAVTVVGRVQQAASSKQRHSEYIGS